MPSGGLRLIPSGMEGEESAVFPDDFGNDDSPRGNDDTPVYYV